MTNAERIAQLKSNIAAKQGVAVADRKPVDHATLFGTAVDMVDEAISNAPAKTRNAWERFELARLSRKAERLGC